jgi:hypothetical protein
LLPLQCQFCRCTYTDIVQVTPTANGIEKQTLWSIQPLHTSEVRPAHDNFWKHWCESDVSKWPPTRLAATNSYLYCAIFLQLWTANEAIFPYVDQMPREIRLRYDTIVGQANTTKLQFLGRVHPMPDNLHHTGDVQNLLIPMIFSNAAQYQLAQLNHTIREYSNTITVIPRQALRQTTQASASNSTTGTQSTATRDSRTPRNARIPIPVGRHSAAPFNAQQARSRGHLAPPHESLRQLRPDPAAPANAWEKEIDARADELKVPRPRDIWESGMKIQKVDANNERAWQNVCSPLLDKIHHLMLRLRDGHITANDDELESVFIQILALPATYLHKPAHLAKNRSRRTTNELSRLIDAAAGNGPGLMLNQAPIAPLGTALNELNTQNSDLDDPHFSDRLREMHEAENTINNNPATRNEHAFYRDQQQTVDQPNLNDEDKRVINGINMINQRGSSSRTIHRVTQVLCSNKQASIRIPENFAKLESLIETHEPLPAEIPVVRRDDIYPWLELTPDAVAEVALKKGDASRGASLLGWTDKLIMQLLSCEACKRGLYAITWMQLTDNVSPFVAYYLLNVRLGLLYKTTPEIPGTVRDIHGGEPLAKLADRISNIDSMNAIRQHVEPHQLAFAPAGIERIVFTQQVALETRMAKGDKYVCAFFSDFTGAFNNAKKREYLKELLTIPGAKKSYGLAQFSFANPWQAVVVEKGRVLHTIAVADGCGAGKVEGPKYFALGISRVLKQYIQLLLAQDPQSVTTAFLDDVGQILDLRVFLQLYQEYKQLMLTVNMEMLNEKQVLVWPHPDPIPPDCAAQLQLLDITVVSTSAKHLGTIIGNYTHTSDSYASLVAKRLRTVDMINSACINRQMPVQLGTSITRMGTNQRLTYLARTVAPDVLAEAAEQFDTNNLATYRSLLAIPTTLSPEEALRMDNLIRAPIRHNGLGLQPLAPVLAFAYINGFLGQAPDLLIMIDQSGLDPEAISALPCIQRLQTAINIAFGLVPDSSVFQHPSLTAAAITTEHDTPQLRCIDAYQTLRYYAVHQAETRHMQRTLTRHHQANNAKIANNILHNSNRFFVRAMSRAHSTPEACSIAARYPGQANSPIISNYQYLAFSDRRLALNRHSQFQPNEGCTICGMDITDVPSHHSVCSAAQHLRTLRHTALVDCLHQNLSHFGLTSQKEPYGVLGDTQCRPDLFIVTPHSNASLLLDVKLTDAASQTNILDHNTHLAPLAAAKALHEQTKREYSRFTFEDHVVFHPLVFETDGGMLKAGKRLLRGLCSHSPVFETEHLYQDLMQQLQGIIFKWQSIIDSHYSQRIQNLQSPAFPTSTRNPVTATNTQDNNETCSIHTIASSTHPSTPDEAPDDDNLDDQDEDPDDDNLDEAANGDNQENSSDNDTTDDHPSPEHNESDNNQGDHDPNDNDNSAEVNQPPPPLPEWPRSPQSAEFEANDSQAQLTPLVRQNHQQGIATNHVDAQLVPNASQPQLLTQRTDPMDCSVPAVSTESSSETDTSQTSTPRAAPMNWSPSRASNMDSGSEEDSINMDCSHNETRSASEYCPPASQPSPATPQLQSPRNQPNRTALAPTSSSHPAARPPSLLTLARRWRQASPHSNRNPYRPRPQPRPSRTDSDSWRSTTHTSSLNGRSTPTTSSVQMSLPNPWRAFRITSSLRRSSPYTPSGSSNNTTSGNSSNSVRNNPPTYPPTSRGPGRPPGSRDITPRTRRTHQQILTDNSQSSTDNRRRNSRNEQLNSLRNHPSPHNSPQPDQLQQTMLPHSSNETRIVNSDAPGALTQQNQDDPGYAADISQSSATSSAAEFFSADAHANIGSTSATSLSAAPQRVSSRGRSVRQLNNYVAEAATSNALVYQQRQVRDANARSRPRERLEGEMYDGSPPPSPTSRRRAREDDGEDDGSPPPSQRMRTQ